MGQGKIVLYIHMYILYHLHKHIYPLYMCFVFHFSTIFLLGFVIVEKQLPMHGLGMSFPFTLLMLNNTINPLVVAWIVHLEACKKMKALI